MSRTKPTDTERAELLFACGRCAARPDAWCIASTGEPARWLHSSRWHQLWRVIELSGWAAEIESTTRAYGAIRRAIHDLLAEVRSSSAVPYGARGFLADRLVAILNAGRDA